jgi:Rad3-related DNA helicase
VLPNSLAAESLAQAFGFWEEAREALDELGLALDNFIEWRAAKETERDQKDRHSLLNEYVLSPESAPLLLARADLGAATQTLSATLAQVVEQLDTIPMRGLPRLRRQLELLRGELETLYADLDAWMPLRDGKVEFNEHTFYDVVIDPRGRTQLAARVLLPNEYLGRHYYPELKNAVLLSATTWLRKGFESAQAYLGLDRAASPASDETRPACVVRCVRAIDPFDYRRVLVALPKDAPPYSAQREAWSEYVRRFITHLGERTRGRMLVLFTNQEELRRFGEELSGFFRARRIPFWYQGMRGVAKEELAQLFRSRTDSILMGVDTFWYGADFPGETLEYLVILKLPYGVPDRYHHAQCAAIGSGEQRRRIYMPRALAKFRQGFGRLMRRESDRGCVFVLDVRALARQHHAFLDELPLAGALQSDGTWSSAGARLVRATTDECLHAGLAHMDMLADVRRRGLDTDFAGEPLQGRRQDADAPPEAAATRAPEKKLGATAADQPPANIDPDDVPF